MRRPVIVVLWLLLAVVVVDAIRRSDPAPIMFGFVGAFVITGAWLLRRR